MRGGKSAGRPFLVMSLMWTPQRTSESFDLLCSLILASFPSYLLFAITASCGGFRKSSAMACDHCSRS